MGLVSRMGKKFAIHLPKAVVEALNISEGDRIIITVSNGSIVIKPIKSSSEKRKYGPKHHLERWKSIQKNLRKSRKKTRILQICHFSDRNQRGLS